MRHTFIIIIIAVVVSDYFGDVNDCAYNSIDILSIHCHLFHV